MAMQKPNVGTNVPSPIAAGLVPEDKLVRRYNQLNQEINHLVPEVARAYDALARSGPLLQELQALLSQRPKRPPTIGFSILQHISSKHELPTWSQWISRYAKRIDYSVRHIRRIILAEPRTKMVKQCP